MDLTRQHVARAHGGDAKGGFITQHLCHLVVPEHGDLGVFEQAVLHDLFSAQAVAPVDQRDLAGEVGQEQRLFHGRVAATDHNDFLATVKEPIAGGAGRYAKALEFLL